MIRDTYITVFLDQADTELANPPEHGTVKVKINGITFELYDAAVADHVGRVFLGAADLLSAKQVARTLAIATGGAA